MTSPTHRSDDDHRSGGWASVLRWVALTGTLSGIATLEYLAGQAAGWGTIRSIAVPATLDAFVMSVLLADRARWYDRAAALGLMESTVVISAIAGHHGQGDDTRLGAVLATALVFVLWRVDETFRADKHHDDHLADAVERLSAAEQQAADLLEQVSAARAETARAVEALEDERANHAAEVARLKADSRKADDDGGRDKPGPKAAPGRVQARAILTALKDFEVEPNAKLSREHGGSDTFWRQRKDDLRAELAANKRGAIHAVPTSAAL